MDQNIICRELYLQKAAVLPQIPTYKTDEKTFKCIVPTLYKNSCHKGKKKINILKIPQSNLDC